MALDTRPGTADVSAYAGDTLTLQVTVTGMDLTTAQWQADIRASIDDAAPVASFTITPPTAADGPAFLVLDSETTRLLATGATRATVSGRAAGFSGVWDCQVSDAGDDPVRTLVKGSLTIDLDVTREPA